MPSLPLVIIVLVGDLNDDCGSCFKLNQHGERYGMDSLGSSERQQQSPHVVSLKASRRNREFNIPNQAQRLGHTCPLAIHRVRCLCAFMSIGKSMARKLSTT